MHVTNVRFLNTFTVICLAINQKRAPSQRQCTDSFTLLEIELEFWQLLRSMVVNVRSLQMVGGKSYRAANLVNLKQLGGIWRAFGFNTSCISTDDTT